MRSVPFKCPGSTIKKTLGNLGLNLVQPLNQDANLLTLGNSSSADLILDLENANPGKGLTDGGQDELPDGLEPGRVFVVYAIEANVPQPIKILE